MRIVMLMLLMVLIKNTGPQVGAFAPEIGDCQWLQREKNTPTKIEKLKGKVVLIHTFAYHCDPCMRRGVPLLGALLKNYNHMGLCAISFTAYNPQLTAFVKEHGLSHSIALVSIQEKSIPYVNVSKNGLTYLFIVGRNGKIKWRGDYVVKEKEFLNALWAALQEEQVPLLGRKLDSKLDRAVSLYWDRRFSDAKKAAIKAKHKDGDFLIQRIDQTAEALLTRLETAIQNNQGPAFVRIRDSLETGFSKTHALSRAKDLGKEALKDKDFSYEVKAAEAWKTLLKKYPMLLPIENTPESRSFTKKVHRFIKKYKGSSATNVARDWLKK